MTILYPTSLDTLTNPTSGQARNTPGVEEATVISNLNDAVEALELKVGINSSVDANSIDYKLGQINKLTTKGDILVHNGVSYQRLPAGTNGYMIVADSTDSLGVKFASPSAGGTVTNVSGTNANGLTLSITNPTTTPDFTLGTSVAAGMVKSNGTGFVAAVAGTDYVSSVTQSNLVTLTAVGTLTAGMAVRISGGNATPTDTTTNTRVDGVVVTGASTGNPAIIDIGEEFSGVPSVTAGNWYTYGNSGAFVSITTSGPTTDQSFYCPKAGTLVYSYCRKSFSPVTSSCSGIAGSNTSSSIFIDVPTVVSYAISNTYSTVGGAGAYLECSFDDTNWVSIESDVNSGVNLSVAYNGSVLINKIYIRVRTYSGNSTSAAITIRV